MKVSREVDLTHNLVFNKPKQDNLKKANIKQPKTDTYKRYNEIKVSDTSWTTFATESTLRMTGEQLMSFLDDSSTTTGTPFSEINQLMGYTKLVEERICWRKTFKDPRVYEQSRTIEEVEEYYRNKNFPMGGALERWYYKHEVPQIDTNICERCGASLSNAGILSLLRFPYLCKKCNQTWDSIPRNCLHH